MASVYTTEAAIVLRVGASRLLTLTDRNNDGIADSGVLEAAIARAGYLIDGQLRQRFGGAVPFAQITDTPATPELITEIAEDLVLWDLYSWFEPSGRDAEYHKALAQEKLEGLRKGEHDISAARAEAHEGSVVAVYESEDAIFAGLDSTGANRLRGI